MQDAKYQSENLSTIGDTGKTAAGKVLTKVTNT